MKRLPQTLTAAALTSALTFGGAAVAQAQIPEKTVDAPITDRTHNGVAKGIPDPETITGDGVEYFKEGDVYKSRSKFGEEPMVLTKEQALAARDKQAEAPANGENGSETPDASGDQKLPEGIPAPATKVDSKGNTWYQSMKDPSTYVNDPALVNVEITDEMREAYAKAFTSEETKPEDTKPEFDKKKLAWLALPAALIIGGITWYLSQDGKTYVKDEARKNQEPTAEEKAASEQMLNANKDKVMAQGGKLADGAKTTGTTRGMSAETGSNTVARGLAGLAVAVMVAAAAFAARRKFFA
ncbi:hypothetical protein ACQXZL_08445 [Corynebacterium diphtheriae]|uniref:hypothetical protein n=1 Tax=Corynebacterium diphtheriae TaxID=1717 RepID=UPI0002469444|nr:hypothetical protein [Corynebacterium diphtheriae]AEX70183.1 putative secreted protein [Corynebacterium diphtheriae PW8]OKY23466.1 hypothetical protein AO271_08855 [Corynebacterium diphtheriae]OSQ24154.1 hypothetical protein B1A51_03345 [Corynebacterium diphtheriae]RKX00934.1 hypothetical protein D9B85_07965 [Corynebacterium diphtheriae]UEB39472.1 hypothetical protein LK425_02495 [Corynebacterium diphtheriae]